MPRTRGNAWLHRSQVDLCVEVDEPLIEYPPPAVGPVERAIGRHVAGLVPDGATVQVGVGAIRRPCWTRSATTATSRCTRSWSTAGSR
jgi:hypothetical protein